MNIHTPSIEVFLDAIQANSAKRIGGETIADVINDGLHVFREFPNNNGVMLFLLENDGFNFRFSASLPSEDSNKRAKKIFRDLVEKGSIGEALSSGRAQFIADEISGLKGFVIIPLSIPSAAVGLVILAAEINSDDVALLRLCELSAYQFAYALNNSKLLQRLTFNQIVLEQKVSARTIHLEQTQRELKTILDCVQTGIIIVDAKSGEVTSANPAAEEMIGERNSNLIGKHYSVFFDEFEIIETNEINAERRNVESTLVCAGGEIIPILRTSVKVNLGIRQVVIESFVDITARKNAEDTLLRANMILEGKIQERTAELQELVMKLTTEITERERAEEAARQALIKEKELADLKSNFVSMVSHEFRTPLTTILSYTQIMQNYRGKLTDDDQNKYLKNIELAVSRMTSMLNDILFIGKSNSGALTVTMKVVNLFELCNTIIEELRILDAEKHTITFKFDYPASAIRTDEKLLRQILLNLLTNALKYSPNAGDVELNVSQSETSVILQVKDNGIGIPKEYFSNLFESFRRAENVGNISGTGLGLSIVKQSVDLLGGSIRVESVENQGSTFSVELPLS